jgi:hypothetical protein
MSRPLDHRPVGLAAYPSALSAHNLKKHKFKFTLASGCARLAMPAWIGGSGNRPTDRTNGWEAVDADRTDRPRSFPPPPGSLSITDAANVYRIIGGARGLTPRRLWQPMRSSAVVARPLPAANERPLPRPRTPRCEKPSSRSPRQAPRRPGRSLRRAADLDGTTTARVARRHRHAQPHPPPLPRPEGAANAQF